MNGGHSRRTVLQAIGGTGVGVALAGCTSSIPGFGSADESPNSEPCKDAVNYFQAMVGGDAEAAIEYIPYEYDPNTTREEALAEQEPDAQEQAIVEGLDVGVECEESRELDDSEIDDLDADLGEHEITAAHELTLTMTMSGEYEGQSIDEERETSGAIVAIDGDGWFIWSE